VVFEKTHRRPFKKNAPKKRSPILFLETTTLQTLSTLLRLERHFALALKVERCLELPIVS
jgi:hypothetical protein